MEQTKLLMGLYGNIKSNPVTTIPGETGSRAAIDTQQYFRKRST